MSSHKVSAKLILEIIGGLLVCLTAAFALFRQEFTPTNKVDESKYIMWSIDKLEKQISEQKESIIDLRYIISNLRAERTPIISESRPSIASQPSTRTAMRRRPPPEGEGSERIRRSESRVRDLPEETTTQDKPKVAGWIYIGRGSSDKLVDTTIKETDKLEVGSVVTLNTTVSIRKDKPTGVFKQQAQTDSFADENTRIKILEIDDIGFRSHIWAKVEIM